MDEKEKQKMREDEIAQMVTSFCKERLDEEYVHHTYLQLGKTDGNAFSDGKQLK